MYCATLCKVFGCSGAGQTGQFSEMSYGMIIAGMYLRVYLEIQMLSGLKDRVLRKLDTHTLQG